MIWFLGISVPVHRFKPMGSIMPIESYPLVFPFISKAISQLIQNLQEVHNLLFAIFSHECSVLPPRLFWAKNAMWLISHWKMKSCQHWLADGTTKICQFRYDSTIQVTYFQALMHRQATAIEIVGNAISSHIKLPWIKPLSFGHVRSSWKKKVNTSEIQNICKTNKQSSSL